MNNKISIKTISELLQYNFFIPSYQRGYRLTEQQVTDLLNDINEFTTDSDEKNWYCLQPIVVVPRIDDEGKNIWEVVDGQQRLITMFIIFKCINKRKYKIIQPMGPAKSRTP